MQKKMQTLVLAGVISASAITPLAEVYADTKIEMETRINMVDESKRQIYLSDIEYEEGSRAGWGEIRKDSNVEGNGAIKLIVEGETVEFGKGMAAHANSTLIYNVTDYKDTYSKLVTYLGVDASRGSNGNGVRFTISTSENGTTWTDVYRSEVLKGDVESKYVELDLNGANYIKLYADSNGNNSADHSVYGDLKLVKSDYRPSSGDIQGLETVASYDAALREHGVDYNIEHNELTILRRAFVNKMGYGTLKRIVDQDQKYANAVSYLMSNIDALRYFITGGPVNINGSYLQSLKSFADIYDKYKEQLADTSDDNFNLRLAISISLSFANPTLVRFWIISEKDVSAVNRFEVYQALVESGKMDQAGNQTGYGKWSTEQFKELPVPLMRWVVDNRINDDEVFWLANFALDEKAKGNDFLSAYNYITYTTGYDYTQDKYFDEANYDMYNEKYGFGDYIKDYGTRNVYRLWQIFEEGAVCGGLAKTYSNLADTFGRPSSVVGQPGHAATMTWGWNTTNQRYEWMLQNDISGWAESGNEHGDRMLGWGNQSWTKGYNASYNVLATDVVLDYDDYVKATLLDLLADSYTDNNDKKDVYLKALEVQPNNLDAMEGLVNCYKADENTTSAEYLELAKQIIETYTYYPQAMMDLLALIEDNITDTNDTVQLDVLKNNALLNASRATAEQSTCVNMTKQLANHYLDDGETGELATFSFDGENAGQIVLNSKYEGSQIMLEYSLDGGDTWKQTNQHIITLTEEELNSITAENDIQLSLVGTSVVHTIDILAGNTISNSTVYANDNENLLLGAVENLEFSLDGGNTWCDYVTATGEETINPNGMTGLRIEGDHTVKVRYKAYGVHLQSAEVQYTFTENQDTDDRKYVPLKNVNVIGYTSNQGGREPKKFIDGNQDTAWHTTFNQMAENKFYTVELDKVRRITSLEYLGPTNANGRMKNGEIWTSMDGETWTLSGSFTGLANDTTLKILDLDQPTDCKYIKLVATESYGKSSGEVNKYFSGRMLNIYETIVNYDDEITTLPDDVPVEEVTPETPEPPTEEDTEQEPPTEEEEDTEVETPQPPVEDEEEEDTTPEPQPPVEEEKPEEGDKEEGEDTTPEPQPPVEEETPEEEVKPQPPVEDIVPPTPQPPTEEEEEEDTEVETPEFTHDVLELVGGDGQEHSAYEFIVKEVEVDTFQSFLEELKEWTLNFISISTDGEYTSYNLRLDRKSRNVGDTIFITLKVRNSQTEILDILNELGKELNPPTEQPPTETEPDEFEEVLDGTANDNMMVTPEINTGNNTDTEKPEEIVKPNDSENTNTENNTVVDNTSTDNVKTGDVSLGGHILLGASALLGLLKNRRKRK